MYMLVLFYTEKVMTSDARCLQLTLKDLDAQKKLKAVKTKLKAIQNYPTYITIPTARVTKTRSCISDNFREPT